MHKEKKISKTWLERANTINKSIEKKEDIYTTKKATLIRVIGLKNTLII